MQYVETVFPFFWSEELVQGILSVPLLDVLVGNLVPVSPWSPPDRRPFSRWQRHRRRTQRGMQMRFFHSERVNRLHRR